MSQGPDRQRAAASASATQPFQRIVEVMNEGAVGVDGRGRIVYANPAFARMTGRPMEGLIGKLARSRIAPAERGRFDEVLARGRQQAVRGEFTLLGESGQRRPVYVSISRGEDCPVGSACMVVTDITAIKQSQWLSMQLAAIVESSEDAIISTALDGTVQSWNNGAERMFGYRCDEAIGQSAFMLAHRDDAARLETLLRQLGRGQRVEHFEAIGVRRDGRQINLSLAIAPMRDEAGRVDGASAIIRDISTQRKLEAEVLKAAELERQRIGRDLHDLLSQHLSGMGFLTRLLMDRLAGGDSESAGSAARLAELTAEAMELTQAFSQGLWPVEESPTGLMQALDRLSERVSDQHNVRCSLQYKAPVLVHDPAIAGHIYHIVRESIHHAIRDGQPGRIVIRCHQDRDRAVFSVRNDGQALAGLIRENHGLGLRTMHHRARMIGAELEVRPAPRRGLVLRCTLPRRQLGRARRPRSQ